MGAVKSIDGMWYDEDSGVVVGNTTKTVTNISPKIELLKSRNIGSLSNKDLEQIIYYDNNGKWISKYYNEGRNFMTRRLTSICKDNSVGSKDELRVRRLLDLVTGIGGLKLGIEKSRVCKRWDSLMDIDELEINNDRALRSFKKTLKDLDIVREFSIERPTRTDSYLVVNPMYCMNNPMLSDITFLCYSDIVLKYLSSWEAEFYKRKYYNIFKI